MNRQHFTNWAISLATFPPNLKPHYCNSVLPTIEKDLGHLWLLSQNLNLATLHRQNWGTQPKCLAQGHMTAGLKPKHLCTMPFWLTARPQAALNHGLPHFILLLICVPGRGHWIPGSHRHRCWELILSPLREEQALIPAEPPLQSCPATSDNSGGTALLLWFFQSGGWKSLYPKGSRMVV